MSRPLMTTGKERQRTDPRTRMTTKRDGWRDNFRLRMTPDERERINRRRLRPTTETTAQDHIHRRVIIPDILELRAPDFRHPRREDLRKLDLSVEGGPRRRRIPNQFHRAEFQNGSRTLLWHEKVFQEAGLANRLRVAFPMAPSQRRASTNVIIVISA